MDARAHLHLQTISTIHSIAVDNEVTMTLSLALCLCLHMYISLSCLYRDKYDKQYCNSKTYLYTIYIEDTQGNASHTNMMSFMQNHGIQ